MLNPYKEMLNRENIIKPTTIIFVIINSTYYIRVSYHT